MVLTVPFPKSIECKISSKPVTSKYLSTLALDDRISTIYTGKPLLVSHNSLNFKCINFHAIILALLYFKCDLLSCSIYLLRSPPCSVPSLLPDIHSYVPQENFSYHCFQHFDFSSTVDLDETMMLCCMKIYLLCTLHLNIFCASSLHKNRIKQPVHSN